MCEGSLWCKYLRRSIDSSVNIFCGVNMPGSLDSREIRALELTCDLGQGTSTFNHIKFF